MNPKDYLIYADMDGTMLSDRAHGLAVPARSLSALGGFLAAGGAFSVATGRQISDTLPLFPGVSFTAPLVLSNGACIYDQSAEKTLSFEALPEEAVAEAAAIASSQPDVFLITADEHRMYWLTGEAEKDARLSDGFPRLPLAKKAFLSQRAAKMCFIVLDPGRMPWVLAQYAAMRTRPLLNGALSAPIYLEIMPAGVSKANGVAKAARIAGLTGRTLVCFGDYLNDYDMLRAADIAACPANAAPEIREICSIATCSNNDGAFADLLDRLP